MNFYLRCKLENIPDLEFLYVRRVGEYGPENKLLMERFKKILKNNNVFNQDATILSIALDDPQQVNPSECRYDVGIISKNDSIKNINEHMSSRELIGGKYLVFLMPHTQECIQNIWINYYKVLAQK